MKWIILALFFLGCEEVKMEQYILHEDMSPAIGVEVQVWNDEFHGTAYTDENGLWTMYVPPDVIVDMCIIEDGKKGCRPEDSLITPSLDSGDTHLADI